MLPTRPEPASRTTKHKFPGGRMDRRREAGFARKKRNTLRRPVVENREVFLLQVFERLAFSIFNDDVHLHQGASRPAKRRCDLFWPLRPGSEFGLDRAGACASTKPAINQETGRERTRHRFISNPVRGPMRPGREVI